MNIKKTRGRPSKSIENQEKDRFNKASDEEVIEQAKSPFKNRLAIEELITRFEALKKG